MKIHCKYDELVSVNELIPYPKNRNSHPKDQIDRLAKLLEYQGMRAPIVCTREKMIVKGHGTLAAIKANKWTEAPVVYQDFESEEQIYAYVQSDNAIGLWGELDFGGINLDLGMLGPDFDIDFLGIKNFEIDVADKQVDPEQMPQVPKLNVVQSGDIWILGKHRLMCADACAIEQVEKLIGDTHVEMVYTDPPYGINASKKGHIGDSNKAEISAYGPIIGDENTDTAVDAYNLCVTLDIPVLVFWGANHYSSNLPDSSCWIVWDKENTGDFADAELAWTNQKTAVRIFKHMWNGMIKASERGEKRIHPTQKPVALAQWCFENYGKPKTVLDLFGGSGSTLIACEATNRTCLMMEISPKYCSAVLARWSAFSGLDPIRESDGVRYSQLLQDPSFLESAYDPTGAYTPDLHGYEP